MDGFRFNEKYLSQIPALQLLINLGFTYLPPQEAQRARGGKLGNVLFEEILREQLKKINRIQHKGQQFLFSEENIQTAIQRLKNVKYDGLLKTNEAVYDLLTLGIALEQNIEGDNRSFTLNYIDWKTPANNSFHVTAELPVERTRSHETARPDIVLFVNGIPFVVIECKSPKVEVDQAVSQTIRNQRDEYIPKLFTYAQMVLAVNKNDAKYATTGTAARFWSVWHEQTDNPTALTPLVNQSLTPVVKDHLFSGEEFVKARKFFEDLEASGPRQVTGQDVTLHSLCRPERLLDMALQFTVFDGGLRKIARYQQFFAVKRIVNRVKKRDATGRRAGGMVWHTQGSGKSLTMVMLARALALDPDIRNPRIVLVTDRVDLDKQLGSTFAACGLTPERADSGRHLLKLVAEDKAHLITTLINKFDKALSHKKHAEDSADVFVLVDESHRTNFGSFAARMRQMFPMACYLGFTGTPLSKKERNNFEKFGGLIDTYAINQAVKDGAVVPLLYEGRHVEITQNKTGIDTWFERHTEGLTGEQKADLKKKYSRAGMLGKADQVIYMRAFDISEHFRQNWKGTGFKAQLVAPNKTSALQYKKVLDEIGHVSCEVVISPPDAREGYEETDEDESTDAVVAFWAKMMKRYGSEEEYNKQVINQFKHGEDPEILIVVDKLLTGFDAPRNTVLYLTRTLREHTLLQAIARVNRLYDDDEGKKPKEWGYILDYEGILGELDKALTTYSELEGYDEQDIAGALISLNEEVAKLPQRHADLWDIFKEIKNQRDEEAYEQLLGDEKIRNEFYDRLTAFGKTLHLALSSEQFITSTPEKKVEGYKNDLKRFSNLREAVKLRYAETIDYRDYEPKIKKLLDTHLSASEVMQLTDPVNIFDENAFQEVLAEQGHGKPLAAQADTIAHATKKAIHERLEQDPAFYTKFSTMIQQAIDNYRAKRLSDLDYLNTVKDIRDAVVNRRTKDVPPSLQGNDAGAAFYGVLKPFFMGHADEEAASAITVKAALDILGIIQRNKKVGFWDDLDAQRLTHNDIDDYLYDQIEGQAGIPLSN